MCVCKGTLAVVKYTESIPFLGVDVIRDLVFEFKIFEYLCLRLKYLYSGVDMCYKSSLQLKYTADEQMCRLLQLLLSYFL